MKYKYLTIFVLTMILYACGNKSQQNEAVFFDSQSVIEQSAPNTSTSSIQNEDTIVEEAKSMPASSLSKTQKSDNNDNMRGFDPASEDDMDDNGMRRYMENDDDEGWD